jgi:hypothetical protein
MKTEQKVRYYRLVDGEVIVTSRSLTHKSLQQDIIDLFAGVDIPGEIDPMPELISYRLATELQRLGGGDYYRIWNMDTKQLEPFN